MPQGQRQPGIIFPTVLVSVMAALGIGVSMQRPVPAPASQNAPATGGAPKSANPAGKNRAMVMLEDFLAVSALDRSDRRPALGDDAQPGREDPQVRYRVRFLIETVPVPISSALRASFDNDIDAITAAANDADFTLDRFDLPWTEAGREKAPGPQLPSEVDVLAAGAAGKSPRPLMMYKAQPEPGPRWQREPGMVLFRGIRKPEKQRKDGPSNEQRLLLVFLVGETPTRGIDVEPMRNALDQIAGLWKSPDDGHLRVMMGDSRKTPRELAIVGPRFSGSAPSIRNELDSWLASLSTDGLSDLSIRIFAGAATDLKLADVEPKGCSSEPGAPRKAGYLRCRTMLTNLLVSDDERWPLIVPALRHGIFQVAGQYPEPEVLPSPVPNDIALLMEDTPYGRLPRFSPNKAAPAAMAQSNDAAGAEAAASPQPTATAILQKIPGLLRLPYPLQISHLRTAFAAGKQLQTEIGFSLGPPEVPAADEGESGRQDVMPSFSTRSPGYEQLDLAGLLTRIQREHIRYVGIQSTDIADLIFLVSQVRQYSPDSLLFTTSSDLWFLRGDLNPDLYGMLVFSSYPLRSENQLWTSPSKTDLSRQFESEAEEGIFNATLMALDRSCDMLEEGTPFVTAPDCFPPKAQWMDVRTASRLVSKANPVLWAGVVGHDQIWPLYFQQPQGPPSPPNAELLRQRGCVDYPLTFVFVFIGLMSICLITALAAIRPLHAGGVGRWLTSIAPWWTAGLTGVIDNSAAGVAQVRRRQYVATLSIGLLTAFLVWAGYFWLPIFRIGCHITPHASGWTLASEDLLLALTGITLLALTGITLLALISAIGVIIGTAGAASHSDALVSGFSVVLVFMPLALAGWFLGQLWSLPTGFVPLVFLRSAVLGSGVSPLTPLIYLGLAAAALNVCHLRQISLLDDSGLPSSGFLGFEGSSFAGLGALEKSVVRLLRVGPMQLPGAYFLLALTVAQGGYNLVRTDFFRDALDGQGFGLFYFLSALIVYGGLFFLLLRFIVVWAELHKLLTRLFFHPARASYESFRTKRYPSSDGSPVRLLEPAHSMTLVEYCLERARELLKLADDEDSALATDVRAAGLPEHIRVCEEWLRKVHDDVAAADWKKAAATELNLQSKTAALAEVLTKPFERVWRLGTRAKPPGAVAGSSKEHELVDQAELFIAGRVLDFLRRIYLQILNPAQFAVIGIVAVMLASSTYPMPAPDTGLWLAWVALLSAVGVTMYVFVRMNMNRVISMLQGSTPGYFNLNSSFAVQIIFFGFLPILTMLGAHFPHALDGFFSWAGGIFRSAH